VVDYVDLTDIQHASKKYQMRSWVVINIESEEGTSERTSSVRWSYSYFYPYLYRLV